MYRISLSCYYLVNLHTWLSYEVIQERCVICKLHVLSLNHFSSFMEVIVILIAYYWLVPGTDSSVISQSN